MEADHERGSGLPAGLTPPLTALVGREREIEEASTLVRDETHRLVTLTGPGGVGKTHLALHLAHVARDTFPDGVVVAPLASVRDPDLVLPTVAQAVGVSEGERTLQERIVERLSARRSLLVLDNFEHLLPAAPLASRLVAACPSLVVLATSRAALRVKGEHVVPLDPLPLPDESTTEYGDEIWRNPAVRLFVERAREAGASVPAIPEMATAIVGICRRLDGLPLAIELAAAQAPALPPPEMLRRLPRPLSLLIDGPSDAPDRLRTMRDAIAWSYDLLTEGEQALFRRLSIFVGGFGLDAAEALAGGWSAEVGYPLGGPEIHEQWGPPVLLGKEEPGEAGPWQPPPLDPWLGDPMRGVAALVRHSLLRVTTTPAGDTAYQMLETIREFGLERLAKAGETKATAHAHAAFFTGRAEQIGFGMWGPESRLWSDRALADLGNMRAALAWCHTQPEAANQLALRVAESLWPFWQSRGHATEGRTHLEAALARPGGTPVARASAMNVAAFLAWVQADDTRALELLDEALPIHLAHDCAFGIGRAHFFTALVSWRQGQIEQMVASAHQALASFAITDDKIGQGVSEIALAIVARAMGDAAQAQERLERAYGHFEAVDLPWGIATARYYEGELARDQGHRARAATTLHEALTIYHGQGDPWGAGGCIAAIAALLAAGGDREHAARLFGAAFSMVNEAGVFLPPTEFDSYQRTAADIRAAMGERAFAAVSLGGAALDADTAVAEALAAATEISLRGAPGRRRESGGLGPRQLETARLLEQGFTRKEIARMLGISQGTIKTHVDRMHVRFGAKNTTELISILRREGLL